MRRAILLAIFHGSKCYFEAANLRDEGLIQNTKMVMRTMSVMGMGHWKSQDMLKIIHCEGLQEGYLYLALFGVLAGCYIGDR